MRSGGVSLTSHWYNACTVSRRARPRRLCGIWASVTMVSDLGLFAGRALEAQHLEHRGHRLVSLIVLAGHRAFLSLRGRVHGQHAEADGQRVAQGNVLDPASTFTRDEIEVRRVAANDGTERDHAVV